LFLTKTSGEYEMSNNVNENVNKARHPRVEKFFTSLGWLFTSLFLVIGGNYLWYKLLPGYGPENALLGASNIWFWLAAITLWAVAFTRSVAVAREGFVVCLVFSMVSFVVVYVAGAVVYGRYEYAHDAAQYVQKFTDERCASQVCTQPNDAGVVDIDALQVIVDEQDAIKQTYIHLQSLSKEVVALDENVVGAERKAAIRKSLQAVEDALKGRERSDYWLLRSVINFSSLVCEAGNQPAVGAHASSGVAPVNSAKTGLICHPQTMLDYGKSLPKTYPLWTMVLEKMRLLPVKND
jgi:hypothetical protein